MNLSFIQLKMLRQYLRHTKRSIPGDAREKSNNLQMSLKVKKLLTQCKSYKFFNHFSVYIQVDLYSYTYLLREEGEDEGVLDPSQDLIEEAELLMIGDNEKAKLFKGVLARHFFRGMVSVSLSTTQYFLFP